MASLADAGKVTIGLADPVAAGAVPLVDAGRKFPAVSADEVTTNVTDPSN